MNPKSGRLPTLHVIGDSIPRAYYRALKAVWNHGAIMLIEYDCHNTAGELIDPPGRDARMLIEIKNPFAQPRFPIVSYCELGVYIAEILGIKDHRIIPMYLLNKIIAGKDLTAEEKTFLNYWPYTYHQRLFVHPETDGNTVNQISMAIKRVVDTPFTRRAMCTTAVPNLDPFLNEDIPCLRELQLRCLEDERGDLVLNATTSWRSRDMFKAWPDNVIGITFLLSLIANEISSKIGRPVQVGSYADFSMSLHVYGQDTETINGFFETFPYEEAFIEKALTSESAAFMLILDQLKKLKTPEQIAQWEFEKISLDIIDDLINGIESGRYVC